MLDLSNLSKFQSDIERNHVTVYPLIILGTDTSDPVYISSVKEVMLNEEGGSPLNFKDYNLAISNIKESINVDTHAFNISNVTLTLNNYEQNGQRLSDILLDKTNKGVDVYYKTQSCNTLTDCLLVYKGIVKRITHDDSKLSVSLEDLTDITFSKDVPVANLGFGENVFNKEYINRPIPITYGKVDKAPVIPWIDIVGSSGKTNLSIIADDVEVVTGSGRGISINNFVSTDFYNNDIPELMFESNENKESFLYIYKDDYFRVLQKYNHSASADQGFTIYNRDDQYSINDSGQFISINKSFTGFTPENPPALNEFQTVKILRPNQAELLVSEGGVAEEGNVGTVINIEPLTGILNPQGSVDHRDNPSTFFNTGQQSEFSTFSTIPNNQSTELNSIVEDGDLIANTFTNSNTGGISYPDNLLGNSYNYLWLINAWIQTNAHHLNVKFISTPSGNDIIQKAHDKLVELELINSDNYIFTCYDSLNGNEHKVGIYNQYALSQGFQSAWINACQGITGDEVKYVNFTGENKYYFPEDAQGTLTPRETNFSESPPSTFINLSEIFANPDKFPYYPTTVYKIQCHENEEGIDTVYVGQWDEGTMNGALQSNERWFNLFEDKSNDKEYLFKIEDFPALTPFDLKSRESIKLSDIFTYAIKTKYSAKYNGVPFNSTNIQNGNSKIKDIVFAGGYSKVSNLLPDKIKMSDLCDGNSSATYNSGGRSWWMIVDENIPRDKTLRNLNEPNTYHGEFIDESCNTYIKKGTFIPCNNFDRGNYGGINFNYDSTLNLDLENVVLKVGDASTSFYNAIPEERLSLLFPLPNINSTDALEGETNTFVYGSLSLNVPENDGNNHNTNDKDDILVQAYLADLVDEQGINYNAEDLGQAGYGTNLINIQGNNDLFTSGGSVKWDIRDIDNETDSTNVFEDLEKYRIQEWVEPDSANALALVYRIRNDEQNTDSRVSISTDISSVGLLQYSVFGNVFNGSLYADIYGRNDVNQKYTTSGGVAENPADVLYHFVEKELGVVDKTNRESWSLANSINSDIKLAFSVKEKINSKTIVQNIAKNTRLFPKFNYNGEFSYSNIAETYSTSQETIKQSDVIDFSFTRTLSENIKTLVNVKYKKDYATNEYTRETGYCDGYDFFGNGENNKEVYKVVDGVEQWSNRGYNYNLLGLKRDDNILEFESEFIRDYESARRLRDYIYLLHCNQHTIVKCTLPLKYIKLEVGDVVDFDSLNNNTKAFGEDYTEPNIRNGQRIYPLFIITSLTKSSKNIKIECMQLHELRGDFTAGQGSLSRRSILGISAENPLGYVNEHITFEDINIYEDIIAGLNNYLTSSQKLSADLNNDGAIDQYDLTVLQMLISNTNFIAGDVNGDGNVNVADIAAMIEYILGFEQPNITQSLAADMSEDGIINVADIAAIVRIILGY